MWHLYKNSSFFVKCKVTIYFWVNSKIIIFYNWLKIIIILWLIDYSSLNSMLMKSSQFKKNVLFLFFFQLYFISPCLAMMYIHCHCTQCEKCEENSKLFYEIENMQFCPRCTLEYLSFYFSSQSKESVKFCNILFQIIFSSRNCLIPHPKRKNNTWKGTKLFFQKKKQFVFFVKGKKKLAAFWDICFSLR